MKTAIVLLSSLTMATAANACPTCFSALADQSPPFFSDEAYKPFTTPANEKNETNKTKKEVKNEEKTTTNAVDTPAQ